MVKKEYKYFYSYIATIQKQKIQKGNININCREQINILLCNICKKIGIIAREILLFQNKIVLTCSIVENCVKLISNSSFYEKANNFCKKSLENFQNSEEKGSTRKKGNILIAPSVGEKILRNYVKMIEPISLIYLACFIETVCISLLEIGIAQSQLENRNRITIRDMELAIKNDAEIDCLLKNVNCKLLGGGVIPFIDKNLEKKQKRKKYKVSFMKKNHRFRPGTVALKEIRQYQKTSDCLFLTKTAFETCVRNILKDEYILSKFFLLVLQYYIEDFLVDFLQEASKISIHANKVKVHPEDISLLFQLRKYNVTSISYTKKEGEETENETESEIENETESEN